MVAWGSAGSDGEGFGIAAQRYDMSGAESDPNFKSIHTPMTTNISRILLGSLMVDSW